jgi:hypothetical protein
MVRVRDKVTVNLGLRLEIMLAFNASTEALRAGAS